MAGKGFTVKKDWDNPREHAMPADARVPAEVRLGSGGGGSGQRRIRSNGPAGTTTKHPSMKIVQLPVLLALGASAALKCHSADAATNAPLCRQPPRRPDAVSYAPAVLPGKGLAQHPFLYTGEWDYRKTNQTIFVVRDGKVVWTYSTFPSITMAQRHVQELGDATMLSNGNIVFCRKVGASEITPDKKIIWNMDAPKDTEIHSVQPLGTNRVLIVENAKPAKLLIINTVTGQTEKELALPTPHPDKSPHLQFRRVRLTKDGTYLAAHLDDNKVVEYDADGKAPGWSVSLTRRAERCAGSKPRSSRTRWSAVTPARQPVPGTLRLGRAAARLDRPPDQAEHPWSVDLRMQHRRPKGHPTTPPEAIGPHPRGAARLGPQCRRGATEYAHHVLKGRWPCIRCF